MSFFSKLTAKLDTAAAKVATQVNGTAKKESAVIEGKETSEKYYGHQEILSGTVERPAVAEALYSALDARLKQEAGHTIANANLNASVNAPAA
ncbi:UNVERIFIED_CONTAM: hypothetical protein HDU68_012198 [Siphonaria sp. JEL0065]|nr:hypothetical protein HDU68_012198 [Siphonaria sp. JEL0065]